MSPRLLFAFVLVLAVTIEAAPSGSSWVKRGKNQLQDNQNLAAQILRRSQGKDEVAKPDEEFETKRNLVAAAFKQAFAEATQPENLMKRTKEIAGDAYQEVGDELTKRGGKGVAAVAGYLKTNHFHAGNFKVVQQEKPKAAAVKPKISKTTKKVAKKLTPKKTAKLVTKQTPKKAAAATPKKVKKATPKKVKKVPKKVKKTAPKKPAVKKPVAKVTSKSAKK